MQRWEDLVAGGLELVDEPADDAVDAAMLVDDGGVDTEFPTAALELGHGRGDSGEGVGLLGDAADGDAELGHGTLHRDGAT
jgi:hypothetical protein